MSLHKQVPSVLTHGGGSDDAISSAISTRAEHHDATHETLLAGTAGMEPVTRRHMHVDLVEDEAGE